MIFRYSAQFETGSLRVDTVPLRVPDWAFRSFGFRV